MCHYTFIQPPLVGCPGRLLQGTLNLDLQIGLPAEGARTGMSLTCFLRVSVAELLCESTEASKTIPPWDGK